jgi:hypothetical protein
MWAEMTGTGVSASAHVPFQEIQALRDRARRLREIASEHPRSPVSPDLLDMAAGLEERAFDLQKEQAARKANP